jgi:threonine dehydratase
VSASEQVRQLLEHQPTCTRVLTHSSGNHGAALAYAARAAAIACTVVMPRNAPRAKREALLAYGAHLVECEPTMADRCVRACVLTAGADR